MKNFEVKGHASSRVRPLEPMGRAVADFFRPSPSSVFRLLPCGGEVGLLEKRNTEEAKSSLPDRDVSGRNGSAISQIPTP
jgi:hypothetical protein